jgi:hypothetical protein
VSGLRAIHHPRYYCASHYPSVHTDDVAHSRDEETRYNNIYLANLSFNEKIIQQRFAVPISLTLLWPPTVYCPVGGFSFRNDLLPYTSVSACVLLDKQWK